MVFDVFPSNKRCNSIWEFMDWSLCMIFWCMLYLCFGAQGFQNMSRPGCTVWRPVSRWSTGFNWISVQRFLIHMLWGHCVRWIKAQKQEWSRASFRKSNLGQNDNTKVFPKSKSHVHCSKVKTGGKKKMPLSQGLI